MSWQIQTDFSAGILDPKLKGRIDLGLYYRGVETATNVFQLPQGGMTRRPGFEYLATLADNARLFAFEFNTSQTYVIAFTSANWYVFDTDGAAVTNGSHALGADIFDADYVQSGDLLIIVHEDYPPRQLKRTGASTFVWSAITILNTPQYNFDDASSPSPTSCVQVLTFTAPTVSDRYRLVLSDYLTEEITYSATAATNIARMKAALLDLPIIDSNSSTVTITGTGPYTITFSGNSADAYQELGGIIVTADRSSASISATISTPGVSKREPVWSATRGYPKTVIFHEGRLVFGGSKSRPATLWFSFAQDFFNFKTGTGYPDEAITVTLDTDQLNEIVGLSTNRFLQIFTTGQEFYVPVSPLTPDTIIVKPQSAYGAKPVKPHVVDGYTCYIQRSGAAVRRFILSEFETSFESVSVSFLAPDVISNPVDLAVQKGVFNIDASYAYIVNDDGTMGVYLSKKEEGLNAWTKWTTDGLIKWVVAVGDDLFISVQRTINGATVYFLEKLYSDPTTSMWCDAGKYYSQAASTTVSGFDHLDGESIRVVADGAVQADEIPVSGDLTLARTTTTGWAGLDYNPLIKTMPATVDMQTGKSLPMRKRFVRIRPQLLSSLGVYLSNGTDEINLPDRQFDIDDLDAADSAQSGIGQGVRFLGWTYEAQLTVRQYDPLPFTITLLAMELG